jgi:RecB family exonuclease
MPAGGQRILIAHDAASRLAAASRWLAGHAPDAEVLILAPTWDACDEAAREDALRAGARFGVTRLTLDRLAGLLAAPALARTRTVWANGLTLDALAARAVHRIRIGGGLAYYGEVARRPGFARALARTLSELRMNGVRPGELARLAHGGRDLARLLEGAAEEMEAARLADRAHVYETAVAVVRGESPPPVGFPLLLFDLAVRARAEAALLAALAERAPSVLATLPAGDTRAERLLAEALGARPERQAPAGAGRSLCRLQAHLFDEPPPESPLDDTVVLQAWPGEARECLEIARGIQEEASRGVPFDRMAVLLRSPDEYAAPLEEALRRASIPAFFARGTSRPHPAGRALLALLACKAEGLSARRFAEYLSLAQVPGAPAAAAWVPPESDQLPELPSEPAPVRPVELVDDPESAAVIEGTLRAPWRWEELLVEAAVIGKRERWARRLDGLARELERRRAEVAPEEEARRALLDRRLRDLGHLRAFALPLIDRLDALPGSAPWSAWLAALRKLAGAALREPEPVLATLAELEPLAPIGPVELDEVQIVLAPRLRELPVPPLRRRYGAVYVAAAEAARGLAFDVVFGPGLAEKIFPRKIAEDPLLLDRERRALAGAGLADQAERVTEERLALRLAVGAARTRLCLSYPRLDVEQARPRVPSFYALEALRAAEGRLPGFEELGERARSAARARLGWPAPERPEDALDESEYDLALLGAKLGGPDHEATGAATYLLGANPHLARALRARARRWIKRWTAADGLVDPDDLARAALAGHQLAARSYSPTALQHFAACPYRFFLQAIHRLAPREEPVAIEALDALTRGSIFHDAQFEVLTRLRAEGRLPVREADLARTLDDVDRALDEVAERYRDELAPAIPRVWEDAVGSLRTDLREWLRREAAQAGPWIPAHFELSFGIADRDRPHEDPASRAEPVEIAGGLRLRGSIDLVERATSGELRVTDHKTGRVYAPAGFVVGGGLHLQPVLYALACEGLLRGRLSSGRLYYCTADGAYSEREVPLDERARDAAAQVASIVDRALREGFFPAAPREGACEYCDYRPVCGPYEELRWRRKPDDRKGDLKRLRDMP